MYCHKNSKNFNKDLAVKNLRKIGLCTIKNFLKKRKINLIKSQILKNLNKPDKLLVAKNIKKSLLNGQSVSTYTKDFKFNLTKKEIAKGYKFYSKLTNRILLKDPLLNYNIINPIIFNRDIINLCSKFFKKNAKLGFIALNCDFKNNLPKNDVNLFHTDDSSSTKSNKNNLMLKMAMPLHLKNNKLYEYRHIKINKKKLRIKKQYFSKDDLNDKQKKFIMNPKIKSGDVCIFEPNNFFHCGEKTTFPVRIVLTVVYIQSKCYLKYKAKNIKIYKSDYDKLNYDQKKFLEYVTVIN
jgi:hypothetical protein